MLNYVLPEIGAAGSFELSAPFDNLITANEIYTCQGIRRLSDYLADNELPYDLIYKPQNIAEESYSEDLAADMPIVRLQSSEGTWVSVPARYVVRYPVVNGVPYQSFAITVALPPMDSRRDYEFLKAEISGLIHGTLGVACEVDIIPTSRQIVVSHDDHHAEKVRQSVIVDSLGSIWLRMQKAEAAVAQMANQLREVGQYIKTKL